MLLLFDIDGTLTQGGPARKAFAVALEHTYGTTGPIDTHDFSGKTDPGSVREILSAAGFGPREIESGLPRFLNRYLAGLERRIVAEPTTALPGALRLIDALEARSDVFLGLVTGNVKRGAELKLGSVGLWDRFPIGGFGSDHEDRNELPGFAMRRAAAYWGRDFRGEDTVIVGDTPRDVACAGAVGAATLGVTTGRFSHAQLVAAGAERVLPGLGVLDDVLAALLDLSAVGRPSCGVQRRSQAAAVSASGC